MEEEVGGMLSPSGSSPSGLAIRRKNLKYKFFFRWCLNRNTRLLILSALFIVRRAKQIKFSL